MMKELLNIFCYFFIILMMLSCVNVNTIGEFNQDNKTFCSVQQLPVLAIQFTSIGNKIPLACNDSHMDEILVIKNSVEALCKGYEVNTDRIILRICEDSLFYFDYTLTNNAQCIVIFGLFLDGKIMMDKCFEHTRDVYYRRNSLGMPVIYKYISYHENSRQHTSTAEYVFDFKNSKIYAGMDEGVAIGK